MAYKLQLKRGLLASLPNGSVGEPLFTTDTFDLYVGKGDGSNIKLQKFIASGSSSQFIKGDGSLDSTTYQGVLSGTGIVKSTGGTISYLTDNSANWDAAYNDKINSASVTGTTTKTLTLTQQDGGTITASWSDYDTAPVTSVFGRTGNVVATSGDYTTTLVTEGTNLYFTDARARAAITLTTTGSSGSATYVGGTLNIPTYTLSGLGGVPTSRTLTINGTSYDLSADRSWSVGTVTSVDLSVPTGFAITGNPITSSGTLALAFATGYSLPTNASQTNWDAAYNDKINSASVTGTTTKTLTLNQQDGGTITASWTDINTDAVTSVFGRTGAVVAASGDYTTTQVTEGTNLYYTEARVSANTDVAANTAARHSAVTLGTANGLSLSTQQLSLALASGSTTGALSSTDWTTFNSKQAALNGTGFVKISGTTISYDNSTYYLASNPSNYITLSSLSGSSPINYNNTTGQITIQLANGSQNGYLSSTDWNTFNNKQSALTNPVTGTGTTNYIPKFTGSTTLGNSTMSDDGSAVTVQAHMNVYGGDVRFDDERFVYSFAGGTVGQYRSGVYYDGSGLNQRFYINNAEQMRLTSTGLGIGTTSPSAKLTVQGLTSDQIRVYEVTDSTNYYKIGRNSTSGYLDFYGNQTSYIGYTFGGADGTRMTLNASGNLGLGVTPSAWYSTFQAFQFGANGSSIFGRSENNMAAFASNAYVNASGSFTYISTNTASYYQQLNGQHQWYNAPSGTAGTAISFTQAMTLDASGRLGIGSTSPQVKLDIQSGSLGVYHNTASSGGAQLYLGDMNFAGGAYAVSAPGIGAVYSSQTTVAGDLAFYVYTGVATSRTERMRLNYNGYLGIANTSPASYLNIGTYGTAGAYINSSTLPNTPGGHLLTLAPPSTGGYFGGGIGWSEGTNTAASINAYDDGAGGALALVFATGTNSSLGERMRITSGGNLLVGTTSDAGSTNKIQVNGRARINGELRLVDFGGATSNYWDTYHYNDNTLRFNYNGSGGDELILSTSGNLQLSGTIKTAAPTGYSAQPWKLGDATSGTISTNYYIKVEINGQIYSIPALQGTP